MIWSLEDVFCHLTYLLDRTQEVLAWPLGQSRTCGKNSEARRRERIFHLSFEKDLSRHDQDAAHQEQNWIVASKFFRLFFHFHSCHQFQTCPPSADQTSSGFQVELSSHKNRQWEQNIELWENWNQLDAAGEHSSLRYWKTWRRSAAGDKIQIYSRHLQAKIKTSEAKDLVWHKRNSILWGDPRRTCQCNKTLQQKYGAGGAFPGNGQVPKNLKVWLFQLCQQRSFYHSTRGTSLS